MRSFGNGPIELYEIAVIIHAADLLRSTALRLDFRNIERPFYASNVSLSYLGIVVGEHSGVYRVNMNVEEAVAYHRMYGVATAARIHIALDVMPLVFRTKALHSRPASAQCHSACLVHTTRRHISYV